MTSPYALGIAKEIVTNFMDLLGANSPAAADFLSKDATIDWKTDSSSASRNGSLEIFQFFKTIPLFKHRLIEFDCQDIGPTPQLIMVTSDGILLISGNSNRYHATFIIKYSQEKMAAHIVHLSFAFV